MFSYLSPHTKSSATGGPQGLLLLFFRPSHSALHSLCSLPFPTMPFLPPPTFPYFISLTFSALLAGRHPGKGPLAGIKQQRPVRFTGAKQNLTSGGLVPLHPASLLTPPSTPRMPPSLRLCSRGPGRLLLGGGRDTASHRHCTWSSKGTTTLLNFGFLWTNSILFTYLEDRGKKKVNVAAAPTL